LSIIHAAIDSIRSRVAEVMVGKQNVVDLLLTALLARGHVLIDDVPGTGKTKLANALARSIGTVFSRIQFTPDLQPADITGIFYYDQKEGKFVFRPGPLHANVILADEINRAVPRTQSSLLEAMEERQITVEGKLFSLEPPFIVIATQNPVELEGTFPLPEAQLDRFLLKVSMGYPEEDEEVQILQRFKEQDPLVSLQTAVDPEQLLQLQEEAARVHVAPPLLAYIVRLGAATRRSEHLALGLSPRGSLSLMRAAAAYALVQGRDHVLPDDIQYLFPYVASHRVMLRPESSVQDYTAAGLLQDVLQAVEVPVEGEGYERWS